MRCPCCGKNTALVRTSLARIGVLICDPCWSDEMYRKWYVDDIKASKELQDYFRLLDEYDVAYNCSTDEVYVNSLAKRLDALKEKRKEKYVVIVDDVDGRHPLAEFDDENMAIARVLGWLGSDYSGHGKTFWVGKYGARVYIEYM